MSLVFFNMAVLNEYKNNNKKLELDIDTNESGQVYVFAYYLATKLSHEEQKHWLQYNEKPKENSDEYIKNMSKNFSKFKSFDEFDSKLARFITKKSILVNFHGIPSD